jgi:WXXGXW repeat (2 copies)
MSKRQGQWKFGMLILMAGVVAVGDGGRALAWQDPAEAPDPAMAEVQTRGPVHEAFAQPVAYDPGPGPVVPREPAPPVEEQPPDQKPEGDDVQWIAGYWSWDEDRGDFLWISGIWRLPPPGQQWVPGYWNQVDGGWQWTHGVWTPVDQADAQYPPAPPASIESGPNCDPPAADSIWSPGCWFWKESRYVWRPGCWVAHQPDWNWVPAHYAWTPCGSLFVEGYWDYPLSRRGVLYAPVAFPRPLLARPDFVYRPSVCIPEAALVSSLFVQPGCHQYRFGDYYAASNFRAGIYPWYSYHQSHYGYDPIYSYYSAAHGRDKGWSARLHEEYRYRRENLPARPPHTLAGWAAYGNRPTPGKFADLAMTAPIHRLTGDHGRPLRIEKLGEDRRKELAQQGEQLHQAGLGRKAQETAAAKRSPPNGQQVTRLKLPRTPVGAAIPTARPKAGPTPDDPKQLSDPSTVKRSPPAGGGRGTPQIAVAESKRLGDGIGATKEKGPTQAGPLPKGQQSRPLASSRTVPPARPIHPQPDYAVRPPHPGQSRMRPEPHPDLPPPEHRNAVPAPTVEGGQVRGNPQPRMPVRRAESGGSMGGYQGQRPSPSPWRNAGSPGPRQASPPSHGPEIAPSGVRHR